MYKAPDPIKLLLIDDDDADAKTVTRTLARDAPGLYEVRRARSFKEAIAEARVNPWNVALVDQRLPDGTGATLVRVLRAVDLITPIVMFSGGDLEPLEDLWGAGLIQGVVPKNKARAPRVLSGLLERAFNAGSLPGADVTLLAYTKKVLGELLNQHHRAPELTPPPPPESGSRLRGLERTLQRIMNDPRTSTGGGNLTGAEPRIF